MEAAKSIPYLDVMCIRSKRSLSHRLTMIFRNLGENTLYQKNTLYRNIQQNIFVVFVMELSCSDTIDYLNIRNFVYFWKA